MSPKLTNKFISIFFYTLGSSICVSLLGCGKEQGTTLNSFAKENLPFGTNKLMESNHNTNPVENPKDDREQKKVDDKIQGHDGDKEVKDESIISKDVIVEDKKDLKNVKVVKGKEKEKENDIKQEEIKISKDISKNDIREEEVKETPKNIEPNKDTQEEKIENIIPEDEDKHEEENKPEEKVLISIDNENKKIKVNDKEYSLNTITEFQEVVKVLDGLKGEKDIKGSITLNWMGDGGVNICDGNYFYVTDAEIFDAFLDCCEKIKEIGIEIKGLNFKLGEGWIGFDECSLCDNIWKQKEFWIYVNKHWELLSLETNFAIYFENNKKKAKVFIEGLGLTDFLFSDIVNKKKVEYLDGKKKKTKTVAEIKDEYNKVFRF